uniref:Endonuclease/exonuclease/phosphatase domain-containing protein n=1 Tax=Populus alba TaxID=43335 RepID=A0A4V6ACF8_POPAL|nr:hypothetical protein D5086_0000020940 [Populus alba]
MKKNKLDVCGLLETKMLPARIASMHARRLKLWKYLSNAESATRLGFFSFGSLIQCMLLCLPPLAQSHSRFHLLLNLPRAGIPSHPWLILGYFNSLLSSSDKHNGEAISSYEVSDFNGCCLDIGLRDVNYTGCHYTWSNGTVWSKLDRVLINPFWPSLHRSTHVHFETPGAFSDHSPAAVRLDPYVQGRRSFKFFNMWAAHDQFMGVVSSCWSSSIYGTPMYILCRKLKLLKGPLKELNRLHFSHISERVSRLESQLDQLQTVFQQDRDNPLLLEQDKLLRSKLSSLK